MVSTPTVEFLKSKEAIGARWKRVGARAKVRGETKYANDQPVGACAYVAVHRSTRPHARIVSIDSSEALAQKGVLAVVTGADLHEALGDRIFTGPAFADQPPLAIDKVRYVGEPVAAVLAGDLSTARAAIDLIRVDYDDLQPVYDVQSAIHGRAFVHDRLRPSDVFGDLRHLKDKSETNICYEYNLRTGDYDAAPSGEDTTVTESFWSPPVHHVPIELPYSVASFHDDHIEILTTTQTPSYVRQMAADLLGLQMSQVRVRTCPLGGAFGSKMYDRLEPLVAALAWTEKTTVRMLITREEAFILTMRHGASVDGSMTADADGFVTGAHADVYYDTGAYADIGPRMTGKSGSVALGPYRMNNARIRAQCVYTNKPSAGAFRGFGVPQVTWAHESLVDELARSRGEDPVAFRRRNLLREGDEAYVGTKIHSADFLGCLNGVTEAIDWDSPLEHGTGRWRRGRGVAVAIKAVLTPTVANATLQLNQDDSATILISTVDMGQGSDTIMSQIAAEVLYLDEKHVRVVAPDTDVTPYDTITAGSRSTYHTGNAVRAAAEKMREQILDIAVQRTGARREDLKLTSEGVLNTASQQNYKTADLLHDHFGARGTTLTTESNFTTSWTPYDHETGHSSKITEHWFAGAAAVDLQVDRMTGRVHIDHLAVAGDVGRAINPTLIEQQLRGAAIMGLGITLFEELVFDQGQMVNATMLDYQLPSVRDVPKKLTPVIVESPHKGGPFGAKGVGETGLMPIAPAVANAVRDATGVRITRLPLTPERVLAAMDEAGVEE